MYPTLEIPNTVAAGPGPGNTDIRVLASFAHAGLADHMQADADAIADHYMDVTY